MKNILIPVSIVTSSLFFLFCASDLPLAQNNDTSEPVPDHVRETTSSSTNNYYLKSAKMYFQSQEYPKAIEALELAILLEPDNAEAHTLLNDARQLLKGKKPEPAHTQKETTAPSTPDKEITPSIQDAYTAIQEERYEDALAISDSILRTDPTNKEALYIKGTVNDIIHTYTTENLKTTSTQEKQKNQEYLREASIPYQDKLRFPSKEQWKDISKRTLPELDKIMEDGKKKTEQLRLIPNPRQETLPKAIEDALNTVISFEFIDTPIKDIIAFVREKTNINMIIDSEGGNAPVTLKLKDVPLRTAFKYLLPKGYEWVAEGEIIHIYRQKMELRVYDVRDILINLDDKEPLRFDITAAATSQQAISRGEPVRIKDAAERVLDLIEQIVTTVEPLSWSSSTGVIGASALSTSAPGGQRRINIAGRGEGSIIARMGQPGDLVVVNSKYIHEQIEALLASLRSSQNLQVSIEARFISVTDKFLEDIGSNITKFFSEGTTLDTGAENVTGNLSGSNIAGLDLNYAILNNSMLTGFLRAVQESKGSEILTSPRITLSNTQRGNIAVVKTINFVQSTSVSESVVTPVIGTIPEGTTFDVRPIVSADRKYIYLEVTPSVFDVIEPIQSFTFSGVGTETQIGGATGGTTVIPPQQTVQLPQVNISQVSVTVCVPDKGTLMIGGLSSISKDDLTSSIPILSKIPIIKTLVSRNQKNNTKSNLIILLKPTIIIREEQEANFLSLSNRKFNVTDLNSKKDNRQKENHNNSSTEEQE